MSVYYQIKEHLTVADTEKNWQVASIASSQLSLLGAFILQDCAVVEEVALVADGATYHFSGNLMTEDYHNLIRALNDADAFELVTSYEYEWTANSVDPGPFAMVDYLQQLDSEAMEGVFYSMWNTADSANTAGVLVAFGEKNGQHYAGEVEFKPVDMLPAGEWTTPLTAVSYEEDDVAEKDLNAIESVCRQLCAFSSDDVLEVSKEEVTFYLNNLRVLNDDQLKSFVKLYAELIDLTDGMCSLIGELVDLSGDDASILHFDVEADGSYTMKMAAI